MTYDLNYIKKCTNCHMDGVSSYDNQCFKCGFINSDDNPCPRCNTDMTAMLVVLKLHCDNCEYSCVIDENEHQALTQGFIIIAQVEATK
jgi:hypothetical protein